MILNVSPNRMELLGLRRRLAVARRGHRLLKDKLDAYGQMMALLVKELPGDPLKNVLELSETDEAKEAIADIFTGSAQQAFHAADAFVKVSMEDDDAS